MDCDVTGFGDAISSMAWARTIFSGRGNARANIHCRRTAKIERALGACWVLGVVSVSGSDGINSPPHTLAFGNPADVVEETGEEVLLMKDPHGRVIGFEKLNFLLGQALPLRVAFETVTV